MEKTVRFSVTVWMRYVRHRPTCVNTWSGGTVWEGCKTSLEERGHWETRGLKVTDSHPIHGLLPGHHQYNVTGQLLPPTQATMPSPPRQTAAPQPVNRNKPFLH